MNRIESRLIKSQIRAYELQSKASKIEISRNQNDTSHLGWDGWIAQLARLSQVGLLIFAVLGYIYTIKPVYNKARLDQEIAQKTIQLKQREAEYKKVSSNLLQLNNDYKKALQIASDQKLEAEKAKEAARDYRVKQENQYIELRSELISRYISVVYNQCYAQKKRIDRLNDSFLNCAMNDAIRESYIDSLSSEDMRLLNKLLKKYGSEIKQIEEKYTNLDSDLNSRTLLEKKRSEECIAATESKSDGSGYNAESYQCKQKSSKNITELSIEKIRLISNEEKEIWSVLQKINTDFVLEN